MTKHKLIMQHSEYYVHLKSAIQRIIILKDKGISAGYHEAKDDKNQTVYVVTYGGMK